MALALASLVLGPVDLAALWARDPDLARSLFIELRLPRTGLALAIGAGLGASGAAAQAFFRNPLASPDVLGPSSGAALGAVLAGYFLGAGVIGMAIGGLAGAGLSLLLLLALAGTGAAATRLVLAGVAVSMLLGVAINLSLSLAPSPFALYDLMFWLMGGLNDRSMTQLALAAPLILAGLFLLLRTAPSLDALTLGEEVAQSLGVGVVSVQWQVVLGIALATGAGVAVAGSIGFIGLIVPHLVRPFVGHRPGAAIAPAALAGAVLLTAADIAVRLVPAGLDLRLGVLTALIGAPFFLWLIMGRR
ncbi:iron ABC transporter permease [Sandarakinorhabdus sp. AAP62]|uniref:FecCD family ABC transporter permease n=1 Tax=Sandarakinorhabdus sp. AAP62 TaxID=1248916 RepID=UPI00031A495E|nr:iron ABC transporter permease [Sandarakinorhabdus sp. AAP62]